MRFDKLTIKSQEAFQEAQALAEKKGNQQVDVEHLLYALLSDDEGTVVQILKRIGIDYNSLRKDIEDEIERFPKVTGSTPALQIYITQRLKDVFDRALSEAEHLKDEYISTEHILIGAIDDKGNAGRLLRQYTITG